ncbi:MAG: S8 family peptidase [Candidatus Limnocylindria bacterium]
MSPDDPRADMDEKRDPRRPGFIPETLDQAVIAIPLLRKLEGEAALRAEASDRPPRMYRVIIDLNLAYADGREKAQLRVRDMLREALKHVPAEHRPRSEAMLTSDRHRVEQYLFAWLSADAIRALVRSDRAPGRKGKVIGLPRPHAIHRIWEDFEVGPLVTRSVRTVKADAAHASFAASGEGIVWAVADSGIQGDHPHFQEYDNLDPVPLVTHEWFTVEESDPLTDAFGHGTHVAGIIAGQHRAGRSPIRAYERVLDEESEVAYQPLSADVISGMAPRCKLVSLKVLDDDGRGLSSALIAAIAHVQRINEYGRRIRIHGLNMSVGYEFDPMWFACGQSPLCREVDRLVRSGVVVVVAAGNTGYGAIQPDFMGPQSAGMDLTINDPGNADLAITVGSTHRDSPHTNGVSYFSSKGPTGDGRLKPDLVAPGEKIVSCAAGKNRTDAEKEIGGRRKVDYIDQSGTSMAAPHVSGVIAAFLSIRQEFGGRPETVKRIFLESATDLRRDPYFQGRGLVDLMRAIQSV